MIDRGDGRPLDPSWLSNGLVALRDRLGLEGTRLHDVRHMVVTELLRQGLNVKVVSETAGHSSTAFTLDTYSHVLPSMQGEVADAMEVAFGSATGSKRSRRLICSRAIVAGSDSAGRGGRTLTGRSPRDFESRASASSAIPACGPKRTSRVTGERGHTRRVARIEERAYSPRGTRPSLAASVRRRDPCGTCAHGRRSRASPSSR